MTTLAYALAAFFAALWYSERDRRLNAERIAKLLPDEAPAITVRAPESIEERATEGAKREDRSRAREIIRDQVKARHPELSGMEQDRLAKELSDGLTGAQ